MSALSHGKSGRIVALPASTTSLLRSTLVIPSLPSALIELVQNALDAEATRIDVSVDLDRWTIKCDDNGTGISRLELSRIAGERYLSSKTLPGEAEEGRETFGFRGEALASLADMGLLELLSKSRGGQDGTVSLVVRGGDRLYEGQARTERHAEGTTVWVRDMFYKWPVRRKPLSTPSARITLLGAFRQSLATLSLLHPLVAFSLVDTSSSDSYAETSSSKRLISVVKSTEGVLGRWRQLWGRAGTEKVWQFERHEKGSRGMRAEGFFSHTAAHSKASQLIYVNARPLAPSPLHKLINDRFSQSTFSRHAASHLTAPCSVSPSRQSTPPAAGTKASRKSPKKSTERFPIFVLNLVAPSGAVDVTLEPEKRVVEFEDTKRVHDFVQGIVDDFLRQQGSLSNPATRPAADNRIGSSASSPFARPSTPVSDEPSPKRQRLSEISENIERPLAVTQTRHCDKSKPLIVYPDTSDTRPSADVPKEVTPIRWTDPSTLQTFLVDPRTGNSWRPSDRDCCAAAGPPLDLAPSRRESGSRGLMVDRSALRRTVSAGGGAGAPTSEVPSWVSQTLQSWTNPIFPSSKPGVPSLTSHKLSRANSTPVATGRPLHSSHPSRASVVADTPALSRSRVSTLSAFFSAPVAATGSSCTASIAALPTEVRGAGQYFTREDLKGAEFVSQVDRKFLLVKMRGRGDAAADEAAQLETLVVVDQHAASERVRVEKLLDSLCGKVARGEELELWKFAEDEDGGLVKRKGKQPVSVVVSRAEAIQAAEWKDDLARWGIGIDVPPIPDPTLTAAGDYIQIRLTSVPLIVSDRLRVEGRLQQELIRSYLAQLVEQGAGRGTREPSVGEEQTWRSVVRHCPPVLLDLINSKACRRAVMFNDELSPEQCRTLLATLADTSFPFQCAHGRPSLMPIVNLAAPPAPSTVKLSSGWRAGPSASRTMDWSRLAIGAEEDRS